METSVAVLGCGYWGSNHIKTLKALGRLAAVSDIDMDKARAVGIANDAPALSPAELFADTAITALILALPPQFHAKNAIEAIKHGKDVLIEKPIALDVENAGKILEVAKTKKRIVMVGHVLRFHSAFEHIMQLVADGELGELRYINTSRLGFGKFHSTSDALWDLAPHDLSMIMALTRGLAPINLQFGQQNILGEGTDFANLLMEFPGNIKANLSVSRLTPYCERRLTVIGNKAMAVFDDLEPWDKKLAIYEYNVEKQGLVWAGAHSQPHYAALNDTLPLTKELLHFMNCVETRETPRTDGNEAIRTLRILEQATAQQTHYRSYNAVYRS
ncbi:MAG: Gfo/Idh/MocA family oxidoreductase [Alphaproteobacteria bacterium]|nr:Gfo/Idh/MocA family oxidoreductase [Alphaproteobacteria bacterium]